jgi:hypothetical protein
MLFAYNRMNAHSQILAEVPFYLPKDGEPVPLLPMTLPDSRFPSLGRLLGASRLTKSGVPREVIDDYLENGLHYKTLRDRGSIRNVESYSSGELSIPDTVIVKNRNEPATRSNIFGVGEVKFPPDDWDDKQYKNATRIAGGDEDKVHTLKPESCLCRGEEQQLEKSAGQPALDVAAQKAADRQRSQMVLDAARLAVPLSRAVLSRNPYTMVPHMLLEALFN